MTTARARLVVAVILLILVGAFLQTRQHDVEPDYQGRTLSRWLANIDGTSSHPDRKSPEFLQASNAVVQIGTNGLPSLVKWIQYEPTRGSSVFERVLRILLDRLPTAIVPWQVQVRVDYGSRESRRSDAAVYALVILGPKVETAIPQLAAIAGNSARPIPSDRATRILGAAGPLAWKDVLQLAMNTNSRVNSTAIWALVPMGTNASPAIPMLMDHLRGANKFHAIDAARVLGYLHLDPVRVVPALAQALQSPDSNLQDAAIKALEKFGAFAEPALPDLQRRLNSGDPYQRRLAGEAIRAITAAMTAETIQRRGSF